MTTTQPENEGTPGPDTARFVCPNCGAFSHHDWERPQVSNYPGYSQGAIDLWDGPRFGNSYVMYPGLQSLARAIYSESEAIDEPTSPKQWHVSWCASCSRASVWRDTMLVHPRSSSAPLPHKDMPDSARVLYEEARDVFSISPRAGAALARATLERLLRELDPTTGKPDLATRIDRVLDRVSSPLAEMLTVIRHVGNKSLHVDDAPDEITVLVLSDEQTQVSSFLFAAINSLVDELVTKPNLTRSMFDLLPTAVQARIKSSDSGTRQDAPRPES